MKKADMRDAIMVLYFSDKGSGICVRGCVGKTAGVVVQGGVLVQGQGVTLQKYLLVDIYKARTHLTRLSLFESLNIQLVPFSSSENYC